jgi:YD repeat-containing protein
MPIRRWKAAAAGIASAVFACVITTAPSRANIPFNVSRYGDFYFNTTDIRPQGALGMEIYRVYNSFDNDTVGKYGTGWGSGSESYLSVQDDGSIVVHEFGGGANNRFTPMTSSLRSQNEVLDEIVRAAEETGQFGSDEDRQKYRQWLTQDSNAEDEWEKFVAQGLLKAQDPALGETFFSSRFALEYVTRVPEGYQRELKSNGQILFEAFDCSQPSCITGQLTRFWDAKNHYMALKYGANGHIQEALDNEGNCFVFTTSATGLVTRAVDTHGHFVQYHYAKDSDLVSVDVNGSVTHYDYDNDDRLVEIQLPDRSAMKIAYNTSDQAIRVVDTDGTAYTYTYPNDSTFDTDTVKPNGETHHKVVQYSYDPSGTYLQSEVVTTDGVASRYTYNSSGDVIAETTPAGTWQYTYDQLHRITEEQTAKGSIFTWTYDPATGNVATFTDRYKNSDLIENFQYDAEGNLTRAYDNDGHDFSISRDPYGRIVTVSGTNLQLSFGYAQYWISDPSTVELGGVGAVNVTYNSDGTVAHAQSSDGPDVLAKVGAALKIVDDLTSDADVDVITLPAPSK